MEEERPSLRLEGGKFDLEGFVKNGTWREMLIELVDTKQIDPWNIDITKIVDGYVDAIKQMRVLDLYIPANVILAASILLRLKSEAVVFFQPDQVLEEPDQGGDFVRVLPDTSGLVYKSRISPHRRITLDELMAALEDAMKVEKKHFEMRNEQIPIPIKLDQISIDQKVERVLNVAGKLADPYRAVTFSSLSKEFNKESMLVDLFIPLLFLANRGTVSMAQEAFFGEIIITINEGEKGG
jgi:segregation and condensation protein A